MAKKRATKSIPVGPDWLEDQAAPPHAGAVFREFYRQAGTEDEISQAECARRMGMSSNRLNEIEREKRGVSPETAVLLGALTGVSAEFWYRLRATTTCGKPCSRWGRRPRRSSDLGRLSRENKDRSLNRRDLFWLALPHHGEALQLTHKVG